METLLDYFAPDNYQLDLTIDRTAETISGVVRILGVPRGEVAKFHAVGLEIEEASVLGESSDFNVKGDVLEIPLDLDLIGQAITLEIKYHTAMNHDMQSCYLSTYQYDGKEQRIAATQFESHYARECFPCIDEPAAKATFDLTLRIPDFEDGDVVLANTPLLDEGEARGLFLKHPQGSARGQRALARKDGPSEPRFQKESVSCPTFSFSRTPRMSTYLLAWVVGRFHKVETVNKNGVKVASYCALNQSVASLEFANDCAARALEYYDEKFGLKYPLPKLDQVALPDFEAGAMENWGLVTYRESMMLASQSAALDTKKSVALTVTHELSHQWFGDLVTMAWWGDLWLNESFASIMEYCCTDTLYPAYQIWQDFFTGDCFAALRRDSLRGVQAVRQDVNNPAEIATLFDGAIVYAKGARLILMLMRLMGEDKFDQGIRDYFKKFAYQNTIGDNLWESLQPYADFDIKDFMHAWISQPGFPKISQVKLGKSSGSKNNLEHRFLIDGSTDDTKWPLPEIFDDMSGHYLLELSDQEFLEKLKNFDQLTPEQHIRLLVDRELLARTPAVPSVSLFELLPRFVEENSSAVWDILSIIIGDLRLLCQSQPELEAKYKAYLRQLLEGRFHAIRFDEDLRSDANATMLREHLLSLAVYSEYQPLLKELSSLYRDNLAEIELELFAPVLASRLKLDEATAFPAFLEKYQSEVDPERRIELLRTISAHAKSPEHISRLVSLLGEPKIVRPQDHIFLMAYLLRNTASHEQALDWLYSHWDEVRKLTGEKSIEDYPRYAAAAIHTSREAERFFTFFDALKSDPVLTRAIEIAHTDITARLALIKADTPAVAEYLAVHA